MKKILKNIILLGTFLGSISSIMFLWKRSIQKIKDIKDRYMSYYQITNQWLQNHLDNKSIRDYFTTNHYENIAIYGMGTLGELLYSEIRNSDVKVKAFIDRNVQEKYENADGILISGLDEIKELKNLDAIIITPIFDYNEIEKELKEKECNIKIISLYGTSKLGKEIVMFLIELGMENKVIAVIDSDEKKWGHEWIKYKIDSPFILNTISNESIIIITSEYIKEIHDFLQKKVKCLQKICSAFSFKLAIHYDIMNDRCDYIKYEIRKNYIKRYNLWKDNMLSILDNRRKQYFFHMLQYIMEREKSVIICGIQKTGNQTLKYSFSADDKTNDIVFLMHSLYLDNNTLKKIKDVLQNFKHHKIKLISGIREPIERIISQKWQNIHFPYRNNDTCIPVVIDNKYENFMKDLINFEKIKGVTFNQGNGFYADIADWFKDIIEKTLEINVFDYSFDKQKGYTIIEKGNVSIFLYRLDKLSSLKKEIEKFSENSFFVLKKTNQAKDKQYNFAYNKYLKEVKVKQSFFDSLVLSKGMTHFYTDEECKIYKEKWKNKLVL